MSGNILIQSNRILTIYAFQIKTHDISKLKFVDFEELPMYIEISFAPVKITLCENYIACLSTDSIHMFKIVPKVNTSDKSKDSDKCDTNFKSKLFVRNFFLFEIMVLINFCRSCARRYNNRLSRVVKKRKYE